MDHLLAALGRRARADRHRCRPSTSRPDRERGQAGSKSRRCGSLPSRVPRRAHRGRRLQLPPRQAQRGFRNRRARAGLVPRRPSSARCPRRRACKRARHRRAPRALARSSPPCTRDRARGRRRAATNGRPPHSAAGCRRCRSPCCRARIRHTFRASKSREHRCRSVPRAATRRTPGRIHSRSRIHTAARRADSGAPCAALRPRRLVRNSESSRRKIRANKPCR
jgi:hypothetical protein